MERMTCPKAKRNRNQNRKNPRNPRLDTKLIVTAVAEPGGGAPKENRLLRASQGQDPLPPKFRECRHMGRCFSCGCWHCPCWVCCLSCTCPCHKELWRRGLRDQGEPGKPLSPRIELVGNTRNVGSIPTSSTNHYVAYPNGTGKFV